MRKYWEFFLQNLNTDLIYRAKFVLSFATHFIVPFTMICIFISLPGNKFAGMTKDQLISYYVFSSFLLLLLDPRIDDSVKTSIQHGDFGRYLIKPIKYWALAVIEDLSHKIIRLVMGMPVLLILVLVSGTSAVYFEWSKIGLFTLEIFLSFALAASLGFAFGLLTFWVEELWGLQHLKNTMIALLAGIMLPYQFFPTAMVSFLKYTPFPYLVVWPLRSGFSGSIMLEIFIAVMWTGIFLIAGRILWIKGLRSYSALGLY